MKFPGSTFQVLGFGLLGPALDSGASDGESEGYGGCRASGFKAPSRRAFELQPSSHSSQSLRTDPSSARTLCVFVLIPWVHKLRLLVFFCFPLVASIVGRFEPGESDRFRDRGGLWLRVLMYNNLIKPIIRAHFRFH